jgi:hypothetical protein
MLGVLDKQGYRFLAGVVAPFTDTRPVLLVAEKDGHWYDFEMDADDHKPSDARFLLQLMLEHSPCTVEEVMSFVGEFAGKYRGKTTWITNAI